MSAGPDTPTGADAFLGNGRRDVTTQSSRAAAGERDFLGLLSSVRWGEQAERTALQQARPVLVANADHALVRAHLVHLASLAHGKTMAAVAEGAGIPLSMDAMNGCEDSERTLHAGIDMALAQRKVHDRIRESGQDDADLFIARKIVSQIRSTVAELTVLEPGIRHILEAQEPLMRLGEDARRDLVASLQELVWAVSKNYENQGIPCQDLVAEGLAGIEHAIAAFDGRGNFPWFVRSCVDAAMRLAVDSQKRRAWIPADTFHKVTDFLQEKSVFEAHGSRLTLQESYRTLIAPQLHGDVIRAAIGESGDGLFADSEGYAQRAKELKEPFGEIATLYFGLDGQMPQSITDIGARLGITPGDVAARLVDAMRRINPASQRPRESRVQERPWWTVRAEDVAGTVHVEHPHTLPPRTFTYDLDPRGNDATAPEPDTGQSFDREAEEKAARALTPSKSCTMHMPDGRDGDKILLKHMPFWARLFQTALAASQTISLLEDHPDFLRYADFLRMLKTGCPALAGNPVVRKEMFRDLTANPQRMHRLMLLRYHSFDQPDNAPSSLTNEAIAEQNLILPYLRDLMRAHYERYRRPVHERHLIHAGSEHIARGLEKQCGSITAIAPNHHGFQDFKTGRQPRNPAIYVPRASLSEQLGYGAYPTKADIVLLTELAGKRFEFGSEVLLWAGASLRPGGAIMAVVPETTSRTPGAHAHLEQSLHHSSAEEDAVRPSPLLYTRFLKHHGFSVETGLMRLSFQARQLSSVATLQRAILGRFSGRAGLPALLQQYWQEFLTDHPERAYTEEWQVLVARRQGIKT
ncbi:MAG: hypothetical protein Greene041619_1141 [Candidatus Peregrinibacteria bacterium Greene0416_19]|nr:MAG: hypothetical protein Greene041619_1141 [Candidatus Peregrinibacteria bacterium Greene0416_19]